jgi:hypothetical protein
VLGKSCRRGQTVVIHVRACETGFAAQAIAMERENRIYSVKAECRFAAGQAGRGDEIQWNSAAVRHCSP